MGLQDVLFNKQEIKLARPLDAYVMENVLFKVSYPAEFHAQTAAECAVILHPQVKDRIDEIDRVVIRTHESAIRIIDKKARFTIRQIVITAFNTSQQSVCFLVISQRKHYEAETAIDPRIDKLRGKMEVTENKVYTEDYLKPDKRSISNAVQIHFKDGTSTEMVECEFPLGHRFRRDEAVPKLLEKFSANLKTHFLINSTNTFMSTVLTMRHYKRCE